MASLTYSTLSSFEHVTPELCPIVVLSCHWIVQRKKSVKTWIRQEYKWWEGERHWENEDLKKDDPRSVPYMGHRLWCCCLWVSHIWARMISKYCANSFAQKLSGNRYVASAAVFQCINHIDIFVFRKQSFIHWGIFFSSIFYLFIYLFF